jgi:hypothetical protein
MFILLYFLYKNNKFVIVLSKPYFIFLHECFKTFQLQLYNNLKGEESCAIVYFLHTLDSFKFRFQKNNLLFVAKFLDFYL